MYCGFSLQTLEPLFRESILLAPTYYKNHKNLIFRKLTLVVWIITPLFLTLLI